MQTSELKFLGVTILQGVEFPVFLLILLWALQQCSATALSVIARYWPKSDASNLPHLYLAFPLGMILLEFRQDFWHRKTRVPGLSYAVLSLILGLAIFVQLRLVSDGQTDGRMDGRTDRRNDLCQTDRRTDGQTDRPTHDDS